MSLVHLLNDQNDKPLSESDITKEQLLEVILSFDSLKITYDFSTFSPSRNIQLFHYHKFQCNKHSVVAFHVTQLIRTLFFSIRCNISGIRCKVEEQ